MNSTKEKIKVTALQLFLERGYSVGINEIIEKAGSSKGSFYHHFKSKEQLFVETVDRYFFSDLEQLDFLDDIAMSFRAKVINLVKRRYIPFKAVNKFLPHQKMINYLNVISEYPKHKELNEKSKIHFENFIGALEKIMVRAAEKGIIKKNFDIRTLCFQIGLLVDGSLVDAIIMHHSISKAEEGCLSAVNQLLDLLE